LAGLISGYIQHFTYAGLFLVLVLYGMGLFYLSRLPLFDRNALRTRAE
jgi:hypothetical protein